LLAVGLCGPRDHETSNRSSGPEASIACPRHLDPDVERQDLFSFIVNASLGLKLGRTRRSNERKQVLPVKPPVSEAGWWLDRPQTRVNLRPTTAPATQLAGAAVVVGRLRLTCLWSRREDAS